MPYLKNFVNISLDYPVYVDVPAGLDYDDILELIEDSKVGWAFADADVIDLVSRVIPEATCVAADLGAPDDIFDTCPDGSPVYKLSRISTPKTIRRFIADGTVKRLKEQLEEALEANDYDEVRRISEELCKLQ